jgi:hypothetical protein
VRGWLLLAGALAIAGWAGFLLLTVEPGQGAAPDLTPRAAAARDPRALRGPVQRHDAAAPRDHIGSASRDALLEILRESDSGDDRGEVQ